MKRYSLFVAGLLLAGCTIQVTSPTPMTAAASQAPPATEAPPVVAAITPSPVQTLPVTPSPSPSPTPRAMKVFDDLTFSFSYPADWELTTNPRQGAVLELKHPKVFVGISAQVAGSGGIDVAAGIERLANDRPGATMKQALVGGLPAYLHTAPLDDEHRSVMMTHGVIHGGILYRITVGLSSSDPDVMATAADVDGLLNSWKWKNVSIVPTPAPTIDPCPALLGARAGEINQISRTFSRREAELQGSLAPISSGARQAQIDNLKAERRRAIDAVEAKYAGQIQAGGCE